jgi:hypothetical protein
MLSQNEKKYLQKIVESQNKILKWVLIPFLGYATAVPVTALVFFIIASVKHYNAVYLSGLITCPIVIVLFSIILIRVIKKDKPTIEAGETMRGYYEDQGVLTRIITRELNGRNMINVSRWFLNDVCILLPPYADMLSDMPLPGIENGMQVKKARLISTTPEGSLKLYPQAYLLSCNENQIIENDYKQFIKPYRFSYNGTFIYFTLILIFMLAIPFYILWNNPSMAYGLVHQIALVFIIPLIIVFFIQLLPMLKNITIKSKNRDRMCYQWK